MASTQNKGLEKDFKEPWEVHGKINSLDIDRECLTGQVLRNFSQSCKVHHRKLSVSARVQLQYIHSLASLERVVT